MSGMQTLHFSFGPVQGFVAHARRTRDFWAGSYLLSYLAGCAMVAVEEHGGEVAFPDVRRDPLVVAIRTVRAAEREGRPVQVDGGPVGSLPNRFRASLPEGVDGQVCTAALYAAWQRVADHVFERIGSPQDVADRWRRQVTSTWDCIWVLTESGEVIDARKNLRSHIPPPEEGEKCSLCGERQELSGRGLGNPASRGAMREWWRQLRKRLGDEENSFDLQDSERLCAVCLTKRLFPLVAQEAIGWEVGRYFPSTYYVGAVPWLVRAIGEAPQEAAKLADATRDAGVPRAEAGTRVPSLLDAVNRVTGGDDDLRRSLVRLTQLDGKVFFEDALRAQDDWPEVVVPQLPQLIPALRQVYDLVGKPSPFFGLLVMDGDDMGALLRSIPSEKHRDVSAALLDFAHQVAREVEAHLGALVYAGGDDMLALLPVSKALDCALACRRAYQEAFAPLVQAGVVRPARSTISAAVVFAHVKTPLTQVIADAHRLLDSVAKEEVGRDALACRVWKRGGPVLTWAQPWDAPDGGVDALKHLTMAMRGLAPDLPRLPSAFLYRVRELFPVLPPGTDAEVVAQRKAVLAAELLASRDLRWPARTDRSEWSSATQREAASGLVARLLGVCQTWRRTAPEGSQPLEAGPLRPDGAMLVRFLAREEV